VRAAPAATRTDFGRFDLNEMSDVPLTKGREPDESMLIRYLVGQVSEAEEDQLDELSVASEDFAVRLRAVELDLVDAYVHGELTGATLDGFKAQYLRTPWGLAAVEFAQALRGYRRARAAGPAADHLTVPAAASVVASGASGVAPAAGRAAAPQGRARLWPLRAWGLAAAAILLVALASLLVDDLRLRRGISGARETHAALEERARQLQEELNEHQAAARAIEQELARAREAIAAGPGRAGPEPAGGGPGNIGSVLALVLSPARRGGAQIPQFTIPPGAGTVVLRLPLVAVDFAHYEAVLRDATGDRVLWRSGRLAAPTPGDRSMIPVTVPANLLAPREYTLDLTGSSGRGAEPLDSYPFRVIP
jgi:hypothetical protein